MSTSENPVSYKELRYGYFRDDEGKTDSEISKLPVVCAGYTFDEEGLKFALSFCAPNDNFSKKKAHAIITGRYNKGSYEVIPVGKEGASSESVLELIEGDIVAGVLDGAKEIAGVPVPFWLVKEIIAANPEKCD